MMLQEVGGPSSDNSLLQDDWYARLTAAQLGQYVRYLFIYKKEGAADWSAPIHTKRRPVWDGGKDRYGVSFKSVWLKIVRAIQQSNAHPGIWVAAHFSAAVQATRQVQHRSAVNHRPEILAAATAPDVYNEYIYSFDEMFLQQYESADVSIRTRLKLTTAFDLPADDQFLMVICDTSHVNAPPFLRYAFAARERCTRAMRRFLLPAALDYEMHQPLYDAIVAQYPDLAWLVSDGLLKNIVHIRKHWSTCGE